ncbi:MAG TPA: hypothetical protein VLS91_07005 [Acidimicrobiales bacterium]|nr:hypothetical protein [Acidimicrobiales bacterium]
MARFRVLWGDPMRGLEQVIVDAHDLDEALVTAHELRPDLARPRVGFLIEAAHPLA